MGPDVLQQSRVRRSFLETSKWHVNTHDPHSPERVLITFYLDSDIRMFVYQITFMCQKCASQQALRLSERCIWLVGWIRTLTCFTHWKLTFLELLFDTVCKCYVIMIRGNACWCCTWDTGKWSALRFGRFVLGGKSGRCIHIGRWVPIASVGAVVLLGTST